MNYPVFTLLVIALPFIGFLVLGIWGRSALSKMAGWLGTTVMLTVTTLCLYIAYNYFFVDGKLSDTYQPIIAFQKPWLGFDYKQLSIDMGFVLDPIAVMMLVVISVVSLMVHIFSIGYMKGEERFGTYYSFLGLFTFSMLGLVLSSNIFQLYMFWELVGVSSYLLIGFYFTKPSAVAAAKKAFIVTRFADFGFLIGILILGIQGGSLDFLTLIERLSNPSSDAYLQMASSSFMGISAITWALVLVFAGGAGKSAMFPLHIWLPDAMEGPTPVSALIHAATMVVAGVFLVARMFPVFHQNGVALDLVAWTGAFSALFAAIIACTQTDIKRVLAYSTMSQIGYMMFALGVSGHGGEAGLGYTASMFHLFTHAFFKSLLFLGAGAIIHAVHSNDMQLMGGLRKSMPVTHASFLIACLAIAGLPPLSGFFSKEEILLAAFENNKGIYTIGLLTAGITAFYMFRLYFRIFWNKTNTHHPAHDGGFSMNLPLIILSVLSIGAGIIAFSQYVTSDGRPFTTQLHLAFSVAPVLLVLLGIAVAFTLYKNESKRSVSWRNSLGTAYNAAKNKFYVDELYQFFTSKLIFGIVGRQSASIDKKLIDGSVNGIGKGTLSLSERIKGLQTGSVQQYVWMFFVGALVLCFVMIVWLMA